MLFIQKAYLTVEENTRLKSRLAEAVQRQTSSAEQDYEEVIQLLETEIRDLKKQLAGKRQPHGSEASKVRQKQLKKTTKKTIVPSRIAKKGT